MIVGTRVLSSHLKVGSVKPMMMENCIAMMEEGEASCYNKEHGGDIDLDIALSYIDEKIERFLGHFQKDFEGGVSAENLGSKYGGYGSFLPTYERPPSTLPHNINQQRDCNAAPTPDNVPLVEVTSPNPKAPPPERPEAVVCNAISSHNSKQTSGSISRRVDSCLPSAKVSNSCLLKGEASGRSDGPMNNRSLKFRIKVCSDSTALKNAAIYSGLGLDDSPLSSSENSSDLSEGLVPISRSPPDESPTKIIEAMTSFPVPNGALISPLHDSLLGLSRNEKPFRETKPMISLEDKKAGLAKLANETTLKQNDSTLVKKKKEVGHRERQVNYKNEVRVSLGKEKTTLINGKSENEVFESKDLLSNESQCKPVSEGTKSISCIGSQKKKIFCNAAPHKTDKDKASIKKETHEIVGEKKLKVLQTVGGKIAGSFEEGFKIRSEASKSRKVTDSDTPERENRRHKLKVQSNEKAGAINRASGDLRKVNNLDDSGIKTFKSSTVVEPAVVALMDEWVCCDTCQKWRLLPFGEKPQLPEKWLCSMLNWLPGMNNCEISEQETTDKLYALYQLPLPKNGDVLVNHANGLPSGGTSNQGKNKEALKEIQNPVSRNDQTRVKSSMKNQQLDSRKNGSLNGFSNPPNQSRNSMDQTSSDLNNSLEGKNRGNLKEKSIDKVNGDQLKRKSKRPADMRSVDNPQDFVIGLEKLGSGSNSGLKNIEGGEGMLKHKKLNTENKMQISLKKRGETAEISSVVRSSVNQVRGESACTKKRKLKDWQDDHNSLLHEPVLLKEESCERLKKKKKPDVPNDFTGSMQEISQDKEPRTQNKKIFPKQTSVAKVKFGVKVYPTESVSSSPMRTSGLDQFGGEKEEITSNVHTVYKDTALNSKHDSTEPSSKKRKQENFHAGAKGLEAPQNLKVHDAEDQRSGALFQSNKAVRLQTKRSQDFEAGNKGDLRTVKMRDDKSKYSSFEGERKEESSRLGSDPLRVSIRAGNSHQLVADASKSDDVVESKTLNNLGNAGNASNVDRMKSSDQTACNTLEEAKTIRDSADRFKGAKFGFESSELYFQSALKYLHGAFLLETLDNASDKNGDISPLQFYGFTAELCETCALEYEHRKQMAEAALAFKCIEVAYLRIVYHKHSSINGDCLDMHSLFRTIVQGESPSSSASDVDNLSNQGATEKAIFDKVGGSLTAGSHIWNARNCARFARVLDFARYTNLAMEAARKSQSAFAAASSCATEKKHVDCVASIKKALDFSFQDVGELVQLVRVAMKTIDHSRFPNARD